MMKPLEKNQPTKSEDPKKKHPHEPAIPKKKNRHPHSLKPTYLIINFVITLPSPGFNVLLALGLLWLWNRKYIY